VMSVLFGRTHLNSVLLLNRAGYDVVNPPGQGCCGALYSHGGNLEQARAAARVNIAAFEALDLDAIIINAAGCGSALKEYDHLLEHDAEWRDRALMFSRKVRDLTEWLIEHPPELPRNVEQRRVTYHDACHLAHAQKITRQPRDLVRAVAGQNYVELPESEICCGSAGSYNLTEPAMAERLQRRKTENILRTGAEVVVTTNPGCILQIEAGLRKAGATQVKVMHIADFLALESCGTELW
jgi:glycolate oxidase iron-sulfur subunit